MSETGTPGPAAAGENARWAELASALRIALTRLGRQLRTQRRSRTLTPTGIAVLATLDCSGPLGPTELAEREGVQKPSMSRVLAALEEGGLVVRTPHPSDRRQSLVDISPAGRAGLARDRSDADAWLARRLSELSEADAAALRAALPVLARLAQSEP